jgi:plastocyanin
MYFNAGYNPVESRSTNFKLFKRIILRFFAFLISTNDSNILNVHVQGYVNATIVLDSSTLGKKSYKPNSIEIPVGNSVVWTNDDFVSHSVTAIKGEFDSNILRAGDPT